MGAAKIIPSTHSGARELAMKFGATPVFDPNAEGRPRPEDQGHLQGPDERKLAGGRDDTRNRGAIGANIGPDFVIEAVGYDRAKPKVEAGPDPTGILPLQQMWQSSGHGARCARAASDFLRRRRSRFP